MGFRPVRRTGMAVVVAVVFIIGACRESGEERRPTKSPGFSRQSGSDANESRVSESGRETPALVRKLNSIVIPRVEFVNTPFVDALDFLVERSRELDPDGTGVNVVLAGPVEGQPQITLELTNAPLSEVLRYTVQLAGARLAIEEHAVVIGPRAESSPENATPGLINPATTVETKGKLSKITIPAVEFRESPLPDVLVFLRDKAVELDQESPPEERGIDIMLSVPPDSGIDIDDLRLTLELKNAPLGEVFNYVAKLSGLELNVEGETVVLSAPADE